MPNLIMIDFESNSGRVTGGADILTVDAIFCTQDFKILDEFSCTARLRKSRVYEVDSFLVNGLDPYEVDKYSNSNFDLTKKTNDKLISWINKGPCFFIAHNGYNFDYMLFSQHLFVNLFSWQWIFSTGNARQIDSLPVIQNFDFYAPNKIAFELNEKNNFKIFKLGSLAKANGFEIKELHTSRGDIEGMMKLMQLLHEKDPALFRQSLSFTNKADVLYKIKDTDYFCFPETFFGRTRQFTGSYVCEHPFYNGYHLIFDLKHDVEQMFAEKSLLVLKKTLFGAPKKLRTIKVGKNPFIQDKSFATKFNDEYATLGHDVLKRRADFILKNRKDLTNKIQLIIKEQFEEKTIDQTELLPEQKIFSLEKTQADKVLMDNYVIANTMEEQLKIHKNFKGDIKHLSEMILLDRFDKEPFTTEEYKRVRKGISRKLLSTNKEVFPTISDGFARIDQLREEKKDDKKTLEKVERINNHLEILAKDHEKYL